MTGRAADMLLAAGGTLLVTGLLLAGTDIHRAARVGPRWRRRLVAAGITLLTALGVLSCGEQPPAAEVVPPTVAVQPAVATEPAYQPAKNYPELMRQLRELQTHPDTSSAAANDVLMDSIARQMNVIEYDVNGDSYELRRQAARFAYLDAYIALHDERISASAHSGAQWREFVATWRQLSGAQTSGDTGTVIAIIKRLRPSLSGAAREWLERREWFDMLSIQAEDVFIRTFDELDMLAPKPFDRNQVTCYAPTPDPPNRVAPAARRKLREHFSADGTLTTETASVLRDSDERGLAETRRQ